MTSEPALSSVEPAASAPAYGLDRILAALRERLPPAAHTEAEAFARSFYRRMTQEEFEQHDAQAWAALSADFQAFARDRAPGEAKVRLFNPARAEHGWDSQHTVLQIANGDMPFLVDSVTMALAEMDIGVHVLGHPVIELQRDSAGNVVAVGEGITDSLMHVEIDRQSNDAMPRIEVAVRAVLEDVRAIVRDWEAMRDTMLVVADEIVTRPMPVPEEGRREAQEFLRWAASDHFTFFGYRQYAVKNAGDEEVLCAVEGTGLGLLRGNERGKPRSLKTLVAHSMPQSGAEDALILTKTNARSTVHRPGYMDYIGVLAFDADGRPVAEQRFLGLYTSSAYHRRPWEIPLVRQRHEHVMEQSGLLPGSHSGKALKHILESLPRDELFQANEDELLATSMGILALQERVRSRLFLRRDRYGRFHSALVYIPRDRLNTDVRLRIEAMLKDALKAEHVDTNIQVGESPLAQLHMIVRPKGGAMVEVDHEALETQLEGIVRNWQDALRDELVAQHGEEKGLQLAGRFGHALPAGYIEEVTPGAAAVDVQHLSALQGPEDLRLSLCRQRRGDGGLRFKLYRQRDGIPLSDVLPMMENMGLRVISEHPYQVDADTGPTYIQDFEVELARGAGDLDVDAVDETFEEAFDQLWRGRAENDGFNRLILAAGLSWRQVAVLRAYSKYLLQVGVPFSQTYVEQTLARYPLLARLLLELFEARFDPRTGSESAGDIEQGRSRFAQQLQVLAGSDQATLDALQPLLAARSGSREQQEQAAHAALLGALDQVSSLDEDRIVRSYIGVIEASLRTNFYQSDAAGAPPDVISFKFDSSAVPDLPKPRPYREIFVYSPRVEGVHLRFGPVARGGLRWSDRREDFRTEVLGLVKAQMVKNAVIVAVGAKGGFFVKTSPVGGDRDAIQAEGIACYKLFINALLDITDNIVEGKIIAPRDVVRHDGDDPYLVVAADKGTATFSDIANGIAAEHSFWLGDAFASGGSAGYDHKGMGITAKGAWESVMRHFRSLGRDSQRQDFTVVGIGDMSGDVFGNGMLLSKHIRLLAAFDHRHIFLDPDPDAAASFAERERMFALQRSSWADYDTAKISDGGGVHARSLKSIPLTQQVKAALRIDDSVEAMSPPELMTAILKAPVDLLWNGGIGTYVKAADESHADVGDRANNAIRVDGRELRCRMVGEGGNLGCTQKGRVEAALNGVLLNTDFIDNSAGVDTSDHEVNIKILLNPQVQSGALSPEDRKALLASMTDEVAALVLTDNYRQNQAISLMQRLSLTRLGSKQHFVQTLETQGLLDRQLEFLPSDAEFADRKARGLGLTRPELSVLLSYAKLVLFQQLLASAVPEDAYLSKELERYFPTPLQQRYAAAMQEHRLKREIIATAVTNSMVNRMGATFTLRMTEDTGRTPAEVAQAYTIARESLDARALWTQVDALDGQVPEAVQLDALKAIWSLLRALSRWLLSRPGTLPEIAPAVERYHAGLDAIRAALPDVLPAPERAAHAQRVAEWTGKGLPQPLADQLVSIALLDSAYDIVDVAQTRGLQPVEVARTHFALGDALQLPWLKAQIESLPVEGRWHAHARGVLRDELAAQQRALVGQVLASPGGAGGLPAWLGRDDPSLRFTQSMFAELRNQKTLDYPTVSVAVRRLAQMAAAS